MVPFDIPIEAFAVEVGGGAHPSVRSLGDRRLVYVEHRIAVRRHYRRRQLMFAIGISGAFVAVAAVALAPGGAVASDVPESPPAPVGARAVPSVVRPAPNRPVDPVVRAVVPVVSVKKATVSRPAPPVRPADPGWRKSWRSGPPVAAAGGGATVAPPALDDRNLHLGPPTTALGYQGAPLARDPFLVCTRWYESVFAGGYGAKSPGGQYRGAYQFDQITWNAVARHLGHAELVGVDPAIVAPSTQDLFAYTLYKWQGASHWNYRCDGLP